MCFLKASNQKQNHPSAFKKYDFDHHQTLSQDIEQEFKYNCEVVKKNKEISEVTYTTLPQIDQSIYFQFSMLMDMVNFNNSLTFNLLEKNQIMKENIIVLQNIINEVKGSDFKRSQDKKVNYVQMHPEDTGDQLINKIFGYQKYKYQLVCDTPFIPKLYKQRNFDLNIKLVDVDQNVILNSNAIPISFSVYTSDDQPQVINENKSGQPILKGNSENQIYHGISQFKKIHIREVSSYYTNGLVSFVIYPKAPSFSYNNRESTLEQVIDYTQIKPLVLSEVIIRAKKK